METFLINYYPSLVMLFIGYCIALLICYPMIYTGKDYSFYRITCFMYLPVLLLAIPGKGWNKRMNYITRKFGSNCSIIGLILYIVPWYICFFVYSSKIYNEEQFSSLFMFGKVAIVWFK